MALIHDFPLSHLCSFTHDLPKYATKKSLLMHHHHHHHHHQFRCLASAPTAHDQDERQSANYQPSIWSYDFVQSLKSDFVVTTSL